VIPTQMDVSRCQSSACTLGEAGFDVNVGACPGANEERDGVSFSPNGGSGQKMRSVFPDFARTTRINVSRTARYRPRDQRTQPTVAECVRDEEHIALLRRVISDARANGSRVRVVGAVARKVLVRLGIPFDEAIPHPSGRNYRWWRWLAERQRDDGAAGD
jgi:hypothetical protein